MKQRKQPTPSGKLTPGEMELMSELWQQGPLTIAQVHQSLGRPIGYTTVQTRLNRLLAKGLVSKSGDRPARYAAAVTADRIGAHHLDDLVERVAGGKVVPLVAHLVQQRALSRQELEELKQIVRTAEIQTRKGKASS